MIGIDGTLETGRKNVFDVQKSLIEVLRRVVGSTVYNTLFITQGGKEEDFLRNGEYACAWFVSNMLVPYNIIGATDVNVLRLVALLRESEKNGLVEELPADATIESGDVIVWEAMVFEGGEYPHYHIGIAVSSQEAVSTSYTAHCVVKHLISEEYGTLRPVVVLFRPNWGRVSTWLWKRMSSREGAQL